MPTLMRAAIVRAIGAPVTIEERPIPVPGPGEVLVRLVASELPNAAVPALPSRALGHTAVGYIVQTGAGSGMREGDRVGVACIEGCLADYVVVAERRVIALPRALDLAVASPVLGAGARSCEALRFIGTRPGQWVAVWGLGGVGRFALQYARAMGMRVVAIDRDDAELELACRLGAHLCINSAREDVAAVVAQRTIGGAHGALVTPESAAALWQAAGVVRSGAICAMVSAPGAGVPAGFAGTARGVTVRGPVVDAHAHLQAALQLAATASIGIDLERHPLSAINDVLARLSRGESRGLVVLDMVDGHEMAPLRSAA